jgi:RNA polymerase sigma-70 factor (subfamily 1)
MTAESKSTEDELIRRFREGDEKAFRILCDGCVDTLRARADRWLSKAVKRRLSVADVVQESMISAFEQRADLEDRGPGSFRKWLLGIVDMKARRAIERHVSTEMRTTEREITRSLRSDTRWYRGNEASPSQDAIGAELEDLTKRAMAKLSEDYREVLILTRTERLTLREVAQRMGRSREAVKKLYGRALREFSETLNRMRGFGHE